MGLTFTDDELLTISQILSQTKWGPNQAEGCMKVSAVLRKIEQITKAKIEKDKSKKGK